MSHATETEPRSGWLTNVLLMGLAAVVVLVGVLSYTWFIEPSAQSISSVQSADAVVVFVGTPQRLDAALELMRRGVAENLVIPNGRSDEVDADDVCDETTFVVFCPATETVDTRGEARVIGRVAEEQGWSSLIAVTSGHHIHRATYHLNSCHAGSVQAVASDQDIDRDDLLASVIHEWLGTIAAMTVHRAC